MLKCLILICNKDASQVNLLIAIPIYQTESLLNSLMFNYPQVMHTGKL